MDFVTIKKTDPAFDGFMLGTFSKIQRALPVRSFRGIELARGEGASDVVTFQLVDVKDFAQMPLGRALLLAARPELLPLSLYPLMSAILLLLLAMPTAVVAWKAILATLAVVALHASVFLMNDVADHLKGLDAVSMYRGSQVIQRGFMTARQMQRWAMVFLGIGVILGAPSVLLSNRWLPFLAVLAPLAMVGFTHRRFGLKYWGVGDALIFLFFGPFLVAGTALATSGQVPLWIWHLGIIWGWLSVVIFQLRSFENLFADGVVRSGTFLSRLGFDRAKTFLILQLAFFVFVWGSWALELRNPWLWLPTIFYVGIVFFVEIQKIRRMPSPLSSLRRNLAQNILLRLILAPLILVGITWLAHLK